MRELIVKIAGGAAVVRGLFDDDGLGNGPYKMKLTIWREGDHAFFDWTGTGAVDRPDELLSHEGMFKMFIGVYLIMVIDPQILFNDGFYVLIHVMPKDGCCNPPFPPRSAAARMPCAPVRRPRRGALQAGAGADDGRRLWVEPALLYSGVDIRRRVLLMEILYGGIPGRPIGDGLDGHSWWPLFENIPTDTWRPTIRCGSTATRRSPTGRRRQHRGGNGVEKLFYFLEEGESRSTTTA